MRQWRSRRKLVTLPLFPGYIFVQPLEVQYYDLKYVIGSCGLIHHRNQPAVVQQKEIDHVNILLGSQKPLTVHNGLQMGDKVRVAMGPLTGIEGVLVRVKSESRLVINAEVLGQSVSIEIDGNILIQL